MNIDATPAPPAAAAEAALTAQLYRRLRVLARARLRDGGRNTLLDTTSLVHEAYLRMGTALTGIADLRQLMAYASRTMRSVIVDFARKRMTQRRGGDLHFVTFTGDLREAASPAGADTIVRVHEALQELAQLDPRLAQVVEMRYFAGFGDAQIAQALGVSERTVGRDWEKARLLLERALGSEG